MTFYRELMELTGRERQILLSIPVITEALDGRISMETYIAFLREAYHHVRNTVPLLMACGSRLPPRLEWLRKAVAEYIAEEAGHQDWILDDIEACGANRAAVADGEPAQATDIMVAFAWDTVLRRNPVGFFGMVLVLEGTSVTIASRAAAAIRDATGLPENALRYLTSHGSLDQLHIKTYERLVNRLDDSDDRDSVVRTARVMYRLYGDVFRSLPRDTTREAA